MGNKDEPALNSGSPHREDRREGTGQATAVDAAGKAEAPEQDRDSHSLCSVILMDKDTSTDAHSHASKIQQWLHWPQTQFASLPLWARLEHVPPRKRA
jgi:hypothetical protein